MFATVSCLYQGMFFFMLRLTKSRPPFTAVASALIALCAALTPHSNAQHIETSTFNQAPLRPKDDPKVLAKGKQVYDKTCASCHATDMRGVDGKGHSILRSQDALTDHTGENLVPIILGKNPDLPSHTFDMNTDDANAVAAYVRSLIALIGSQGRPPGDSTRSPSILVGDASVGKQYFAAHCASCHSADTDLKGYATKLSSPKTMQASWIKGNHLGVPLPTITVTVTAPRKPVLEGTLIHIDDFIVTLKTQDGSLVSIRREGATPRVEVHDPLDGHRNLLPAYTDKDIHDVTAYLVTLK
jgi:cytochrome c oxidase cbb3-type subunit 3